MKSCESTTPEESIYIISGKSVIDFHRYLRETEENRNLIVPHERRQVALLKRHGDDKLHKVDIHEALDVSFKNSSKHLFNTMETIKAQQGFTKNKTEQIHNCVKSLSQKGYTIGRHKEDDQLKREFKLANIPDDEGEENIDNIL